MKKEIKVGERTFVVRELLAVEMDGINFDDKVKAIKEQVMISTGLSEEEYKLLTVKERFSIVQTMNEVNGLSDFQKPTN